MKSNKASKEGFRTVNYPKNRKSRSGKCFWYTRDPIGRYIKTAIGIYGDTVSGMSVEIERNFKAQGVGSDSIFHFVTTTFPEFPAYYYEIRGLVLTKQGAGDRYHKQYYDNDAPRELRGRRSKEHYLHDPKLRGLVPTVDARLKQGGTISLAEILKAVEEADKRK